MSFFRQYSLIIGILVLVLVLIVLASVPSAILAPQATFIGTELQYAGAGETPVRTMMDFGNVQHMQAFPKKFGDWIGLEKDPSGAIEGLGAELVILRTYLNTGSYHHPMHFAIVQSQEPSSFHPPPICYRAANWEILEESDDEITVSDITSASAAGPVSIGINKMVVSRESGGEAPREREIVLYYYVKGRMFENTITMIEASASVPADVSDDDVLADLKEFMVEVVPYMFEPVKQETEMLAIHLGRSWGGRAIIAVLVLIPLAFIIYPRVRRR
jgi:hypothetical protein